METCKVCQPVLERLYFYQLFHLIYRYQSLQPKKHCWPISEDHIFFCLRVQLIWPSANGFWKIAQHVVEKGRTKTIPHSMMYCRKLQCSGGSCQVFPCKIRAKKPDVLLFWESCVFDALLVFCLLPFWSFWCFLYTEYCDFLGSSHQLRIWTCSGWPNDWHASYWRRIVRHGFGAPRKWLGDRWFFHDVFVGVWQFSTCSSFVLKHHPTDSSRPWICWQMHRSKQTDHKFRLFFSTSKPQRPT